MKGLKIFSGCSLLIPAFDYASKCGLLKMQEGGSLQSGLMDFKTLKNTINRSRPFLPTDREESVYISM